MEYSNIAYLLTGGNVGNKSGNLERAVFLLEKNVGTIKARSAVYETAPWGNTRQDLFLNQALELQTNFSAEELMQELLQIEKEMGRIRQEKNGPRIIDLDILFFNREVITSDALTIPHKELANRRFVLQPLAEIAPLLVHPVLNKSVAELLEQCMDDSKVIKL